MEKLKEKIIGRLLFDGHITGQEAEVLLRTDDLFQSQPDFDFTKHCCCRIENGGNGMCHCTLGNTIRYTSN